MARKPAAIERAGALTPRDRMWGHIRALAASSEAADFTPAEIIVLTGLHVDTVCTYIRGLCNARPPYARLLTRRPATRARRECFRYSLVRDVGATAPGVAADGHATRIGESNELQWCAMKVLRSFTAAELAYAAQTAERSISVQSAKTYIKFLRRAGYVTITVPAKPGIPARYKFSRNTGPRAPLVCRDKSVIDANTGRTMWRRST